MSHMSTHVSGNFFFLGVFFPLLSVLILTQCLICVGTFDSRLRERERERERERYTSVFVCVCVICVGSFENYDSERDRARQTLILSYVLARLTQVSDRDTHTECVLSQVNKLKKNHIR